MSDNVIKDYRAHQCFSKRGPGCAFVMVRSVDPGDLWQERRVYVVCKTGT